MSDGFCPFATVRNIPPGVNDPAITPRLAILHVDAGNASTLYDYFSTRSGGIESHFFVKADGTIEQYRSIYWQADANLDANDFAVSIETQGYGAGTWNAAQLASIKRLLLWLHETADIPLTVCKTWDGSGVGYHTMFGAPGHWTPVAKTCPGPERIKQFDGIIRPWLKEQSKPQPPAPVSALRWTTANVDFVRGGDAAYLAHLCAASDVLLVQEAKDLPLADMLPKEWGVLQETTSPATMGSAIIYRRETVRVGSGGLTLHPGAPATKGMLPRYIASAPLQDVKTGEWRFAVAAHLPPRRFKVLQPGMTGALAAVLKDHLAHAVVGVDANQPLTRLASALHMRSYGEGIVGLIVGSGLRFAGGTVDPWGIEQNYTDHPSITARVRHI